MVLAHTIAVRSSSLGLKLCHVADRVITAHAVLVAIGRAEDPLRLLANRVVRTLAIMVRARSQGLVLVVSTHNVLGALGVSALCK